jgi:hypothetical protein
MPEAGSALVHGKGQRNGKPAERSANDGLFISSIGKENAAGGVEGRVPPQSLLS